MVCPHDELSVANQIERQAIDDTGRFDSRKRRDFGKQPSIEAPAIFLGVAFHPQVKRNGDGALRLKAEVQIESVPQASDHLYRRDDQHDREGDLSSKQKVTDAQAAKAIEGRFALQAWEYIGPHRLQGGR